MLDEKEINNINACADSMVAILLRFPDVQEAGKSFYFSPTEQPDPLRFICEGNNGGYIIEIGFDLFYENIDQIDLLTALLHLHVLERQVYPTSDWKTFHFTSSSGLEEVQVEIPKLAHRVTS